MSARLKSDTQNAVRTALSDRAAAPDVDPVDDALWHLHVEACRVVQLVRRDGLSAAQRRDLERSLAVLRAATEWYRAPARKSAAEPEPAL